MSKHQPTDPDFPAGGLSVHRRDTGCASTLISAGRNCSAPCAATIWPSSWPRWMPPRRPSHDRFLPRSTRGAGSRKASRLGAGESPRIRTRSRGAGERWISSTSRSVGADAGPSPQRRPSTSLAALTRPPDDDELPFQADTPGA